MSEFATRVQSHDEFFCKFRTQLFLKSLRCSWISSHSLFSQATIHTALDPLSQIISYIAIAMIFISSAKSSASQIRSSYHSIVRRTDLKENDFRYDFIMFLETCQNLEIDFLSITWQSALDVLRVNEQSEMRQSSVNLIMSFAFNRMKSEKEEEKREENEEKIYRALISQVSILRHSEICNHSNIIHLIDVCWDVRTLVQENDHHLETIEASWLKVWSILIFEKTKHEDLNCFMRSDCDRNLDFTERLKLCIDIVSEIRDLHRNREWVNKYRRCLFDLCVIKIVHRDIKSHNVLISEDKNESYTAKIADLEYFVLLFDDSDHEYMSRFVSWEASKQHDREHLFSEMIKMNIYFFDLICLWFLFNDKLVENDLIFHSLSNKRSHSLKSKK